MPVRCWIQSSLVSITRVRSALVTTLSGRQRPRPAILEFVMSSQPQDRGAPVHSRTRRGEANQIPLADFLCGACPAKRERQRRTGDVSLVGPADPRAIAHSEGLRRGLRGLAVDVLKEVTPHLAAFDTRFFEHLADARTEMGDAVANDRLGIEAGELLS